LQLSSFAGVGGVAVAVLPLVNQMNAKCGCARRWLQSEVDISGINCRGTGDQDQLIASQPLFIRTPSHSKLKIDAAKARWLLMSHSLRDPQALARSAYH
jgi:hypothetical protein